MISAQPDLKSDHPLSRAFVALSSYAERFAPFLVAAALLTTLAVGMVKAFYTPFWYDEDFSVRIAKLPHLADIWAICRTGVDPQPPSYYYLLRASLHIFGNDPWGTRVPSLLGYLLFCLSLYWFVGRRTSRLYGFIAFLFPTLTTCWFYATDARPYAIALGCAGLAAVCWQSIVMERYRTLSLIGLGASLALSMSVHYYSIFALFFIGLAEIVRTIQRRKLDWFVWFMLIAPVLVWIPFLSVMRAGSAAAGTPGVVLAKPAWFGSLVDFSNDFLEPAILPVLAALCICVAFQIFGRSPGSDVRSSVLRSKAWLPEASLIVAFLLVLPVTQIALAKLVTHVLFSRYLIDAIFGVAVVLALALWFAFGGRKEPAFAVVLAFSAILAHVLLYDLLAARMQRAGPYTQQVQNWVPPSARADRLPVLVAAVWDFMDIEYYGGPQLTSRACYLADPESPMLVHGGQYAVVQSAPFFGTRVCDYPQFVRDHTDFYVLGDPGWLLTRWNRQGAQVQALQGGIVDKTWERVRYFYRVHLPPH